MNKEVIWEAIKEPLRLLVLAIVPLLVTYFAALPYQWAILATVVLRFIDKWLHEYEKAQPVKKQIKGILGLKGLTGF